MSSENNWPEEQENLKPRRLEVVSEAVRPDRRRRYSAVVETPPESAVEQAPPLPAPPSQMAPIGSSDQMVSPSAPTPTLQAVIKQAQVAAAFEVISRMLAVRLFMLLAVAGAFALGWKANDPWSAGVFLTFALGVVLPMIFLEYKVRRQ
jgi:hypothetical protein